MPTDDQTEDSEIKQFSIPITKDISTLKELDFIIVDETIGSNFYFETTESIENTKKELNKIGSKYIDYFKHRYSANCIKILDDSNLIVGFNDSCFSMINLNNGTEEEFFIYEDVHCHQIISYQENKWIINFFPVWPPDSSQYIVNINGNLGEISIPNGLIYKKGENYIIKQIVPYAEKENHSEYLLDNNLAIIEEFKIGPYNGYQHYFRRIIRTNK